MPNSRDAILGACLQILGVAPNNNPTPDYDGTVYQALLRVLTSGLAIAADGTISTTVPISVPVNVTSATGTLAVTHGGTGLTTVAANRLLYASATDTVAALASANSGVLVTSGGGVPSISTTVPSGLTIPAPVFTGSIGSDLLFTDATFDVGKAGATRPRDLFLSRDLTLGRDLTVTRNVIGTSSGVCQGRLTLTAGTPVTTADVTGATNIFWTPTGGNTIALYDGTTNWTALPFVETTLALGTLTSGLPYDVFAFNNAGTLALEALAWTNGTTRATALVLQNGVLSKTGALTRRYLGTFYTSATTTTEDSFAKRYLWNYYNRVPRELRGATETADTWAYSLSTFRQANANAANQLDVIIGVAEVPIEVEVVGSASSDSAADQFLVGIGEDSTSAMKSGTLTGKSGSYVANAISSIRASLRTYPAVGRHTYVWLEWTAAIGTTTWRGDNGTPTLHQSGIHGRIDG